MEKIVDMKNLIERLNTASNAYYNSGKAIMTDREFDLELEKLKQLELETGVVLSNSPTQTVGSPVLDKLNKIKHEHKEMLSLEKVHSAEEIVKFANGHDLIAMIKLDGLSVRLTYEDGKLIRGETRGNGIEGSDITMHVKQFKNIPLSIDKKDVYVVDGEAIITDDDFEAINAALPEGTEKFKNSRNLASGTLALLDTSLVKERRLSFVLWDVIVGSDCNAFHNKLDEAVDLGFECTPWVHVQSRNLNAEYVSGINNVMFETSKELSYPNDGVVWKLQDVKYGETLGQTSHHFCNAVAFKAKQDEYETVLRDIEWTMGKTGTLCPVAIFAPVEIDGTTVEKASLHNISIMEELLGEYPYVGQKVQVFKANMIIPQISSSIKYNELGSKIDFWSDGYFTVDDKNYDMISIPEFCPICGGATKIIKDNDTEVLVCTNDDCQGKLLGKLSHFVSKNAINIDGMSEATLEFLINKGWVKSFKDIYTLKLYLNEWIREPGFGEKSVSRLIENIEKSKNTTFERFLYAQSIPLIGRSASKDIVKFCNGSIDTFCEYITTTTKRKQFLSIDGFGNAMYSELMYWYDKHWIEFLALKSEFTFLEEKKATQGTNLEGKTFVVTGSLTHFKNREELIEKITSLGGKVSGSVSAKTSYLINNDVNSTSGKNAKAKQLGIPIISEEEILFLTKTEQN